MPLLEGNNPENSKSSLPGGHPQFPKVLPVRELNLEIYREKV